MAPSSSRLACLAWTSLLLAACAPDTAPGGDSATQASTTESQTTGPEVSTGDCPVGMLGCPCTGGGACDPGLICGAQLRCEAEASESTDTQTTLDDTSTSTSINDTVNDPSTGSSTDQPSECTPSGELVESPECAELDPNRPFCGEDGACVGCGALVKNACMSATEGLRPICLGSGACVQCDSPDALALSQCGEASPHCNLDTFTCEGCFEHSECPQTACEVQARKCFPTNKIIYVRRGPTQASPCTWEQGTGGTMIKPYCDVETAIQSVQKNGYSSGYTFHVMASDDNTSHGPVQVYGGVNIPPVSYAFTHDPGQIFDPHTRFIGDGPMITVQPNITLYVVNFGILLSNEAFLDSAVGVDCQKNASVWLDDSRVHHARGVGVLASDCQVHLRRTMVSFGFTEGVELRGGSLHAVNSFISQNSHTQKTGGGALRLRQGTLGAPTVDIVHSTIVNNDNEPANGLGDTITCEGKATVNIRSSILSRKAGTGNAAIVCPEGELDIRDSVVDVDGGVNNQKLAPEDILKNLKYDPLTGAYTIPTHVSATVFANVGQWQIGDVHFDFEGDPRSAVAGPDYAGADVYVP